MKYIVAVSGGLDSVVLLHMLANLDVDADFVVAHVDHGIRQDSDADAWHASMLARQYDLPFEVTYLGLGPGASEDVARQERYKWLDGVKRKHDADGIITAHHQDDQIETVCLNLQRGTGWRGLASLRTNKSRLRPLLNLSKANLVRYAIDNNLCWREDETNNDLRYARNYVRHRVIPKVSKEQRDKLSALVREQRRIRAKIERETRKILNDIRDDKGLSRYQLIMSPDNVALEILREATNGLHEPVQLRKLLHFAKTGRQGAVMNIGKGKNALLTKKHLIV